MLWREGRKGKWSQGRRREKDTRGREDGKKGERRWGSGNNFVPISQMRKVRPREMMGDLESARRMET